MAVTPSSTSTSPKKSLKLNCSYGGQIFPRPSDGKLKYAGGETRVFSFPRSDVSFSELMEKFGRGCDTPFVIKYQLLPEEDLDILVSVKSDEDVRHMLDEYIRQVESGCFSRFRLYLIPTTTAATASCGFRHLRPKTLIGRRYNDSINGSWNHSGYTSVNGSLPTSSTIATQGNPGFSFARSESMHKAHSSPNLYEMERERPAPQSHGLYNKQHRFSRNDNRVRQFSGSNPRPCGLPKPM